MKSIAIVLVCYNRLTGLKRLVSSIQKANYQGRTDITLIFSIDNSGSDTVETYAKEVIWEFGKKRIRTFDERQGLKNHILQCGDFTKEYDVVIVLEDDLFVSDSFFCYASQAAEFYWNDDNIAGISLYNFQKNWLNWIYRFEPMKTGYDTYFMRIAMSWGQVWTRPKWEQFKEWYSQNNTWKKDESVPEYINGWPETSWLKYHDRYCIETNRFFVYPYYSRTTNDHQVELQYNKQSYIFPTYSELGVRYDEYMNRIGLEEYLSVDSEDVVVDLWGTKRKDKSKRFLLTTEVLNYKVVRSFSLSLRPIEASIIESIQGNGIYLYDTTQKEKHTQTENSILLYSLRSHEWRKLLPFSLKLSAEEIKAAIRRRIKRWVKR